MAAKAKYPTPAQQLVRLLAGCKRRGLSWDEAWPEVSAAIRWPNDGFDRRVWHDAIACTLKEFRAAYEDRETPIARTLRLVAQDEERGVPMTLAA